MKSIGENIHPILNEIEETLLEFEANTGSKPNYPPESLRSAAKIFMSVLMDKIWELQEDEKISMEDRCNMAEQCGKDVRKLIKTYTGIDSHTFYGKVQ